MMAAPTCYRRSTTIAPTGSRTTQRRSRRPRRRPHNLFPSIAEFAAELAAQIVVTLDPLAAVARGPPMSSLVS